MMMTFFWTLLVSLGGMLFASPEAVAWEDATVDHDFHVSRTRIEYVPAQQELQLTLHVFIDDLELALEQDQTTNLKLGTPQEAPESDRLLFAYLQQQLQLKVNDQTLKYAMLGKEMSEDLTAFWIYLLVENVALPDNLWIRNRILTDVYDDQQNIIQIFAPGAERGHLLFNRSYTEERVPFNP